MSNLDVIYDEELDSLTAAMLIGKDPFESDVTCKMITTSHEVTIMVHNNITGEETEYPLDTESKVPEETSPMEKFGSDIPKAKKGNFKILNTLTVVLTTVVVLVSIAAIVVINYFP